MRPNSSFILKIPHKVGSLRKALSISEKNKLNLNKIQSKPCDSKDSYDIIVDFDQILSNKETELVIKELLESCNDVSLRGKKVKWFPKKLKDLNYFSKKTLNAGAELESDHPGFRDELYRERRRMINEISVNYSMGNPIPKIKYTYDEIKTWGLIYNKLRELQKTHACKQVNYIFPLLEERCGYSPNNIPQLEDVSNFLKETTGFRLKPISGLLSPRDFLNGLAFRVFHSTQYIRHHSRPLYTP